MGLSGFAVRQRSGVAEHKSYAPGVGNVKEIATKGPQETLELVDVKHE
jgi:hypothetical protein